MAREDRNDPDAAIVEWYDEVAAALSEKPPATVAHELPGLIEHVAEDAPEVDHYRVGVSFTKKHGCLDYAIERIVETDGASDDLVVETAKPPASENHRYVHFVHPPDPHFDASALRARLLGAVHRERQAAADVEVPPFAALWEQL